MPMRTPTPKREKKPWNASCSSNGHAHRLGSANCVMRALSRRSARLHDALSRVPRQLFVAPSAGALDPPSPETFAKMLDALELDGTELVLELGSSSAYQAAVLGRLARRVVSLVEDRGLAQSRQQQLELLGCRNVNVVQGNMQSGWLAEAPYQAIAVSTLPTALVDQLAAGGRIVVPLGNREAQLLTRFRKRAGALATETLGVCQLAMLSGGQRADSPFPWTHASLS